MIKICFPPGCYGSYLSRCIYNYSDLTEEPVDSFQFDQFGSSHDHRDNKQVSTKIQVFHLNETTKLSHTDVVIILPCSKHHLDYFNNQFAKQSKYHILHYLSVTIGEAELKSKLHQGWSYHRKIDGQIPNWILREFISNWIIECFNHGYSIDRYQSIPHKISITTQDIVLNILNTVLGICKVLGLTVNIDHSIILDNHFKFVGLQKHHQSQLRCEQWCNDIIEEKDSLSPCITILDEAYVQYYLRTQGFEIQCFELNAFPTTSMELKKIMYKL